MLSIFHILITLLLAVTLTFYVVPQTRLTRFHNKNRFGSVERDGGKGIFRSLSVSGVSFVPIIVASIGVAIMLDVRWADYTHGNPLLGDGIKLMQLFVGMLLLFMVGLKDDLYGIPNSIRVVVLLVTAAMFPVSGLWINNFYGIFGIHTVPYWIGMPFTTLLVAYLTATINLADGIHGLASGQCSVSLLVVLIIAYITGTALPAVVAAAGLGACLSFFIMTIVAKTRQPFFMGSCGSMPMGYLICYSILYIYKYKEWIPVTDGYVLAAFCTMLMPAWDMLRVLKSRLVDGRSILRPDRNMFNHKLFRVGLSRKMVLVAICGINLFYVVVNGYLLNLGVNITWIFVIDIIIFVCVHLTINYFIGRNEHKHASRQWEKVYGCSNWSEEEAIERPWLDEQGIQEKARQILLDMESAQQRIVATTPDMADIPFIPDGMNALERSIKRMVDLVTSMVCLVAFSPLFLICSVLIKLDDGGPVLFRQQRIGRFGRPFTIYKFRSMRLDAENDGPQLSHANGRQDDRLTRAGRFLRRHHLDELPQLWNVLKGDMAFIGYRPERKYFIDQIVQHDPRYAMLYQIRPGVTSYATLYNGYTDTMEKMLKRLELDLYYLKYRSWWFDAKVLILTFLRIIGGKKF